MERNQACVGNRVELVETLDLQEPISGLFIVMAPSPNTGGHGSRNRPSRRCSMAISGTMKQRRPSSVAPKVTLEKAELKKALLDAM